MNFQNWIYSFILEAKKVFVMIKFRYLVDGMSSMRTGVCLARDWFPELDIGIWATHGVADTRGMYWEIVQYVLYLARESNSLVLWGIVPNLGGLGIVRQICLGFWSATGGVAE